jgi:hypothetical protein
VGVWPFVWLTSLRCFALSSIVACFSLQLPMLTNISLPVPQLRPGILLLQPLACLGRPPCYLHHRCNPAQYCCPSKTGCLSSPFPHLSPYQHSCSVPFRSFDRNSALRRLLHLPRLPHHVHRRRRFRPILLPRRNGLLFLSLSPLLSQTLLFPFLSAASTGVPLSGGSCTTPAYPTTCTVADGSAQYCCPSGTGCFSSATFTCYDQGPVGAYPTTASNFDCAKVVELTIDEAQALFATGELTSRALVSCYLQRIADYDNIGTFKGLVSRAYFALSVLWVP